MNRMVKVEKEEKTNRISIHIVMVAKEETVVEVATPANQVCQEVVCIIIHMATVGKEETVVDVANLDNREDQECQEMNRMVKVEKEEKTNRISIHIVMVAKEE